MPSRPALAAAALLVVIATAWSYRSAPDAVFVFDDFTALEKNPQLRAEAPWTDSLRPPDDTTLARRPVAALTFKADAVRAPDAFVRAAHTTNVAIHAAVAMLFLLLVASRIPGRSGLAAATSAALVFATHPMHVEAVTYAVQRVESLVTLFMLATIAASLRAESKPFSLISALPAVVFAALAAGTKEVSVTLAVLVPAFDVACSEKRWRDVVRDSWKRWALVSGVVVAVLVGVSGTRGRSAGVGFAGVDPFENLALQANVVAGYLVRFVSGGPFLFDAGELNITVKVPRGIDALPGLVAMAAWVAVGVFLLIRNRLAGVLVLAPLVVLAPSSSLVTIGTEPIAEHRFYAPSLALLALVSAAVVSGIKRFAGNSGRIATIVAVALVLVVVARNAAATDARSRLFSSAETLWEATTTDAPRNARAWTALAEARFESKGPAAAIAPLERALELHPGRGDAEALLGHALLLLNRPADARDHLRTAAANEPTASAWHNLGLAESRTGNVPAALEAASRAVAMDPDNASFLAARASLLARTGRFEEAIADGTRATTLEPSNAEAWFNLAGSLVRARRFEDALPAFDRAAESGLAARAAHRKGLVLQWIGRPRDAAESLRTALRLDPANRAAALDLAELLVTSEEASLHAADEATTLLMLDVAKDVAPPRLQEVVALAGAELGRKKEAVASLEALLAKATTPADRERLTRRLAAVKAGNPVLERAAPPF